MNVGSCSWEICNWEKHGSVLIDRRVLISWSKQIVNLARNAGNLNCRTNAIAEAEGLKIMRDWLLVFAPIALLVCFLVYPGKFAILVDWVVKLLY